METISGKRESGTGSGANFLPIVAAILLVLAVTRTAALAVDPLTVVKSFCQADGRGARLNTQGRAEIESLVDWPLEPAWDRVALIKGYEISTPRREGSTLLVDVAYTVVAEISADQVVPATRLSVRTFRLASPESGMPWRILGPPPIPHVFESDFDADLITAALDPYAGVYLSNSSFVWKMLHNAGWNLPYLQTNDLVNASVLREAATPEPGDLAFYYDGGRAYHVGLVEEPGLVVSATLNAGIRRAPASSFAGELRFMRLVGNRPQEMTPTAPADHVTPRDEPSPPPDTTASANTEPSGD